MPLKPIDYSKTVIYYAYYNNNLLYIGHTTDFIRRKKNHKDSNSNLQFHKYIKENNINFEDIRWEQESFPCLSKFEAVREEGRRQRNEKPLTNSDIAGRTKLEWYEDNKEYVSMKRKEYNEENKETIKEQRKEYFNNRKDEKKEYDKIYREKNKEKIKQRDSERITCEVCNIEMNKSSKKNHIKTKKHLENIS